MTYQQLIPFLNYRHFYPGTITKNDKVVGLHLECSTITQKEVKLPSLERILEGTGYRAVYFPNEQTINIIKKK